MVKKEKKVPVEEMQDKKEKTCGKIESLIGGDCLNSLWAKNKRKYTHKQEAPKERNFNFLSLTLQKNE